MREFEAQRLGSIQYYTNKQGMQIKMYIQVANIKKSGLRDSTITHKYLSNHRYKKRQKSEVKFGKKYTTKR